MPTRILLISGDKLVVTMSVKETHDHLAVTGGTNLQSFHRDGDDELVYVSPAHVAGLEPAPSQTPHSTSQSSRS